MPRAPRRPRRAGRPARATVQAPTAGTGATPGPERLQKMLARSGLASRREGEAWIRAGRLTINGALATLGARVAPGDEVRLDGRVVRPRGDSPTARAWVCHRSPGEPLSGGAAAATAAYPGLLARMPRHAARRLIAVSPMPRIDGGLELMTSDGELAAQLQRSVHAMVSEFSVRVRGELSAAQLEGVLGGTLDSGARVQVERCEPAGGAASNRWYTLLVRGASGKEVRQLFERQAALVSRVLRTQLGPVLLERSLHRGRLRPLTQEELRALLAPPGAGA